MKKNLYLLVIYYIISYAGILAQQSYIAEDAEKDTNIKNLKEKSVIAQNRSEWFRNVRLGMFTQ